MVDIASSPFRFPADSEASTNNHPTYFGRNPSHETRDFDTSFSFPAKPSQTPVRHGRRPSVTSNQTTPMTTTHRRNASQDPQATAMSQLQSFSFPSTSAQASPRPAAIIGAGDNSDTPTRTGGRGHRRTASEFVGGDSRTGSATKLRHASVDGGSVVPVIAVNEAFEPFPRPRATHGRKTSMAATPLRQSSSPEPQVIDLDDAMDNTERKGSGDQETPRATHGYGSGSSSTMHSVMGSGTSGRNHFRTPSNGFTPTRRPIPRARVGFADRVDFISRPLSTISSQSGSSMSTIRHSISISSASGYPATSPLRLEEQSYASTSPERFDLPVRPKSTDPVLNPSTSRPTLLTLPETDVPLRPKSAQAFTEFSSPSKHQDSTRKTRPAPNKPVSTKPKRKIGSWAHILGRHSKSTLPPHVNAHQLNSPVSHESSPEISPQPTPVELNIDFDEDPTAVMSSPALSTLSASAPTETFILRPKVSTILEEPDRTSTMIDLDLALDLFNSTPSKTPKGRNFNSARRSMHSGSGLAGLSSPSGHRRAESAPSHVVFDPDQYRMLHNGSTSGQSFEMEDVFEEDESRVAEASGSAHVDSSANVSMPTSFEGERSPFFDPYQRPASASAEQAHIRFEDAARKLQFHRNSTGGFPQYRRHSQTSGWAKPVTPSFETIKELQPNATPTTPQICFSNEFGEPGDALVDTELEQKDSLLSRPPNPSVEASLPSESSSPFTSSQVGFDQHHRGSTTTMATSFVESAKSPSIGMGEPGPEIHSSEDVATPMIGQRPSTSRTPLQPLNVNSRPRGMRSVSSTMSLASAAESISRRKRASLGNLSRLLSGNKSSLSVNVPEQTCPTTPRTPRTSNRLSRVFRFWKSKPSPG